MIPESGLPPEGPADPLQAGPAARFRLAWDCSPALIAVVVGPELVLTYRNRAAERVFGTRAVGHPLLVTFPELTPSDIDPIRLAFDTGQVVEAAPRRVALRDHAGEEGFLRYVLAPPGLPAGKTALLRRAFDATLQDAEFQADAARIQADLAPATGEEVQALVARIYATPRPVIERAKKLLAH